MKKTVLVVAAVLLLLVVPESTFAQASTAGLAATLAKEELLLAPGARVTESDIARLKALTDRIRATKSPELLSRAELLLVLFREQAKTKASVEAFNKSIDIEARTMKSAQWHRTKRRVVRTSFWIGMSFLGLLGASQGVAGWATNQYLTSTSTSSAYSYFVTGKAAQLASLVGVVGAAGGLGTAWLLEVNPFDIPAARTEVSPVSFPRTGMTDREKLSFLKRERTTYAAREKRAEGTRSWSFGLLAAGLTGVLATGISGILGDFAYQKYVKSTNATDATNYRTQVTVYQDVAIGTASLALVGLSGATVGYIFGADPTTLSDSIRALDNEIARLQGTR